uniref:Uncharacterized protein n=1 Tax=Cacopsylla melanoneura TaxID=428564 RepID=A0A8D9E7Z3_9HEMI
MNSIRNKYFKLLLFLHYFGLISIPKYYQQGWKNWLHRNCYRTFVYMFMLLVSTLHGLSTMHYPYDHPAFTTKIYEFLLILFLYFEIFIFSFYLDKFIELFEDMDRIFAATDPKVYSRYEKELDWVLGALFGFCVFVLGCIVLDTLTPQSEDNIQLLTSLYHISHPKRKLPTLLYIPFIDISEMKYFVIVYVAIIYAAIIGMCAGCQIAGIESIYPTLLAAQIEMFCKFIKLLGRTHRNKNGDIIFYSNIVFTSWSLEDIG